MRHRTKFALLTVALTAAAVIAAVSPFRACAARLELKSIDASPQQAFAIQASRAALYMLNNISQPGTAKGSIIASPSRVAPDYYFHWIRDSALTFEALQRLFVLEREPARQAEYLGHLKEFVDFTRKLQASETLTETKTGLGEPKFLVDGRPFTGPWGRPQNDGPALRASALIGFARERLAANDSTYVRQNLYAPMMPARAVIKIDLEYVAHHWRESSFDLWEEIRGDHFYTRMAQRQALLLGADLAQQLGDPGAADFYRHEGRAIEPELLQHWDASAGYVKATLNRTDGADYKSSGLDTAIILGALHGSLHDGFFSSSDDRILATAARLQTEFSRIYAINRGLRGGAVAIGRYPEDRYDGGIDQSNTGNPWFLSAHAFAELCYRARAEFLSRGSIAINDINRAFFASLPVDQPALFKNNVSYDSSSVEYARILDALRHQGDAFLRLSLAHMNQETGAMSEQFNRDTGYMQGARDLTWSYASYLTAYWSRDADHNAAAFNHDKTTEEPQHQYGSSNDFEREDYLPRKKNSQISTQANPGTPRKYRMMGAMTLPLALSTDVETYR